MDSGLRPAYQSGQMRHADAMAAVGLILNVASVIASALSVSGFAMGMWVLAVSSGALALVTFTASLICFSLDSNRALPEVEVVPAPAAAA